MKVLYTVEQQPTWIPSTPPTTTRPNYRNSSFLAVPLSGTRDKCWELKCCQYSLSFALFVLSLSVSLKRRRSHNGVN